MCLWIYVMTGSALWIMCNSQLTTATTDGQVTIGKLLYRVYEYVYLRRFIYYSQPNTS